MYIKYKTPKTEMVFFFSSRNTEEIERIINLIKIGRIDLEENISKVLKDLEKIKERINLEINYAVFQSTQLNNLHGDK
jgi:hypothetical protein